MKTKRLTTAQAIIQFLMHQHVERDGKRQPFFAGCLGIFGHGCIAGIGQALQEYPQFRYYMTKNEQASVHIATAFAKMSNRLRAFACVSSIGPGATNMVTGAATATINRIPVLLLPGDIFARRNVGPVLQQLEHPLSQDISVNDCFRPVSKYWDRINRADQLMNALPEVMRVLTSQAETGAVTLALPQDVQTEVFDYPAELFEERVWHIPRPAPEITLLKQAVEWIRASKKPVIVAGGGVLYSEAHGALAKFAEQTGVPVAETQAGKGALRYDHPQSLGAIGVTGTPGANITAREADLVIGIGTRYSDFTTASNTAFQNPNVRFININAAEFDAFKRSALPVVADARAALEALGKALRGLRLGAASGSESWQVSAAYRRRGQKFNRDWDTEVEHIYNLNNGLPVSQGEVIGAVNEFSRPQDVVLCAAGSLPGDLHKLWRTRDPKGYHMEYGYSCMGYEIAGGLGVKMAATDREVYVMVGDGSWLMMSSELVTSIQEGCKLTVVLLNNHGFQSIGGLSHAIGSGGFGTRYRFRNAKSGQLDGAPVPVDYAASARSLGAHVVTALNIPELKTALADARRQTKTTVIVIETDPEKRVPGYESWWDVPIAETSTIAAVKKARKEYERARTRERYHL
ncbi:MAG: 3D-(3,5/4)-trihydroxycyclohexane-1,2-dione acylhydrolase (decyclizing) [Verrucomicrobia bacterium]|nr:3D-(3,5/4)-trihydroxycyclohexane-1,2-dione acylhydrolase (decyclizing) [Verrucomicrobiota bacterium]